MAMITDSFKHKLKVAEVDDDTIYYLAHAMIEGPRLERNVEVIVDTLEKTFDNCGIKGLKTQIKSLLPYMSNKHMSNAFVLKLKRILYLFVEAPHLTMPPSLKLHLLEDCVSPEVVSNINIAMMNAFKCGPVAVTYANAMELSYNEYGLEGVKTQVMYLMLNVASWKGEEARNCKKILRKWAK